MGHALEVSTSQVVEPSEVFEGVVVDDDIAGDDKHHELTSGALTRYQLALFAPPALVVSSGDNGCTHEDVVEMLLQSQRSPETSATYRQHLKDFFDGDLSPQRVALFLSLTPPQIAYELNKYKIKLLKRQLSESAINGRFTAIRSLLKMAHRFGWCASDGRGVVDNEKVRAYRDTSGLDMEKAEELLRKPFELFPGEGDEPSVRALRDYAILSLCQERGFRRGEIHKLSTGDFSFRARRILVTGKGRGQQKESLVISDSTAEAIFEYMVRAGHHGDKGPLFRNFDHRPGVAGGRLTAKGVYHLVKNVYGKAIDEPNLSPHKLRHTFGTQLAITTKGNAPVIQKLMRHRNLSTSQIYIDNVGGAEVDALQVLSAAMRGEKKRGRKKR